MKENTKIEVLIYGGTMDLERCLKLKEETEKQLNTEKQEKNLNVDFEFKIQLRTHPSFLNSDIK